MIVPLGGVGEIEMWLNGWLLNINAFLHACSVEYV